MSLSNLNQKAVNGKSRNNDCKKHAPLPLFEISLYWAVWIPLLSYAVYAVWIASYGIYIYSNIIFFYLGLSCRILRSITKGLILLSFSSNQTLLTSIHKFRVCVVGVVDSEESWDNFMQKNKNAHG